MARQEQLQPLQNDVPRPPALERAFFRFLDHRVLFVGILVVVLLALGASDSILNRLTIIRSSPQFARIVQELSHLGSMIAHAWESFQEAVGTLLRSIT